MRVSFSYHLAILFGIIFFEILAYSLITPFFFHIFLDSDWGLLSSSASLSMKKTFHGLLLMCYPFAQVVGAPLMGMFSDKKGRKNAFLLTLTCNILGYLSGAIALAFHLPWLIFAGFTLAGLAGGNISISQSAVADISSKKTKARNLSLVFASYGLCYSLGPLIGGGLALQSLSINTSPYLLPFLIAAALSFFNLCFVSLFFKETFLFKHTHRQKAVNFKELFHTLRHRKNLRLMGIIFLSFLGWNFFLKAHQMYLSDRFYFLPLENAYTLSYFGIITTLTQALLLPAFHKYFTPEMGIRGATLSLGISLLIMPLFQSIFGFFVCFTLACMSYSFILPNLNASISNLNAPEAQGKVMGLSQGIQSLAKTLSPLSAAMLSNLSPSLPLVTSGCLLLLTYLIYESFFQPHYQSLRQ